MSVKLTKIIATLGPASGSKKSIRDLAREGVNVFRLNLSHGKHDVLRDWIRWIREAEEKLDTHIGILLDLQGPKIRVGKFENGSIYLNPGDRLTFTTRKVTGKQGLAHVQFRNFHKEVQAGDPVYLDDGNLCVRVKKVSGRDVEVETVVGGLLSNFKGLNLPEASITGGALTAKDKKDLAFGLEEGIDLVALSFAGSARDIQKLRKLIQASGKPVEIIAKIERKKAIENLREIIEAADGVMVARGDLGIEIPLNEVPVAQQEIMSECSAQNKPVIVATQMMESMVENARPTRAEISDISSAVRDCADAIMLSAETAVGKHPVAAVKFMAETARNMEAWLGKYHFLPPWTRFFKKTPTINPTVAYSACQMAELLEARAVLVFTETGGTARTTASTRPGVPMLVFTSNKNTARKLALIRGAVPFLVEKDNDLLGDLGEIFRTLKKRRYLKKGDRVVITAGIPFGIPQWTNVIRVEKVP